MKSSIDSSIEAEFACRFEGSMDIGLITNTLIDVWQEIDSVLSPIIGQRGVAALYYRSLYLTARTYPWLESAREGPQTSIDFTQLKALMLQQQCLQAIASGGLLFKTFYELLVSLVGNSLTERLLRSVGAYLFSGPPAQDCT